MSLNDHPRIPALPKHIPWIVRQACYASRKLKRGYGRVLPALARTFPPLQQVTLDTEYCGLVCVDFRELICLPIFVRGCYPHQVPEDLVMDHILRPGMKVFDIGANIGFYTLFISRRVGDRGLVVAVEPMPRAVRLLKKNAALCGPNIVILPVAVGSQPGEAQISELQKLDTSFVSFGPKGSTVSVEVMTIDQLTEKYGQPDFLKIDVEGAELLALKGATATLSGPNTPIIMIEYIAENAQRFGGYGLPDLLAHFPDDRFKTYRVFRSGHLEAVTNGGPATNDYLAVPLNRLGAVDFNEATYRSDSFPGTPPSAFSSLSL